jgi:hypothetical protein
MQVCTWCRSDVVQGGYGAGECGVVQWCSVVQGESGGWQVDGMVQNEVQGVVRGKCGAVWCRSRVVQVQMVQGECGAGRVWCRVWCRVGCRQVRCSGVIQVNGVQPHCVGQWCMRVWFACGPLS